MTAKRYLTCQLSAWIVLSLVLGYPLYLVLDRDTPFNFVEGRIEPTTVHPGDEVTIRWTTTVRRDCDGLIHRSFTDSTGALFPMEPVPAVYSQVREGNSFARNFRVPFGLAPGPATYNVRAYYWCNWMQRYVWPIAAHSPRAEFMVLPKVSFHLPTTVRPPSDLTSQRKQ